MDIDVLIKFWKSFGSEPDSRPDPHWWRYALSE